MLKEIFYSGLSAVDPYELIKSYIDNILSFYSRNNCRRLLVVGFGKSACPMAKAMEDSLNSLIDRGAIITKYGHLKVRQLESAEGTCPQSRAFGLSNFRTFRLFEAGHPVPDENGLRSTEEIIKFIKDSDENTLIICLISGGGSALLVSPYEGITLDDKKIITELLLKAGANIYELNTVRKHISQVKGGRLAELAYPSRLVSLIISDVSGDRLDVIASGPTAPDKTTYRDALKVFEKYGLVNKLPQSVLKVLNKGIKGLIPETPKEGDRIFEKVDNIIIGNNKKAIRAAKEAAEKLTFHTEILSSEISGEARDVGRWLAKKVLETKGKGQRAMCLISGGETTVTVKGNGIGGRNMELALSFAIEIEGIHGITLLSAGTDGTDGLTDAAGAIVDGNTIKKAKELNLNPQKYLDNNDSYNFFKIIGELFTTGPTGTNVMDLQIVIIE